MDPKNSVNPSDIRNKEFRKSALGYSSKEVAEYLDTLAKAWEKTQKQEKELVEKIRLLNEELVRWKNREHEIAKLKEKAQQEALQIREEAAAQSKRTLAEVEERAGDIRARTEEWLESVIQEVEETQRQKTNFMTAFKAALDSHYELLNSEAGETEPLSAKLHQFLKGQLSQGTPSQPPPRIN